ncbi:hypothetical protein H5410_003931 [Solanum commersonii]|uniref:Uncharacterized protein n=1 Tax=Solanum commersonii TaxID=4109 RepID=A0A9J6B675_SOLCO|nr:hypothetical protein H5410_003931 [Solanum commersonii]
MGFHFRHRQIIERDSKHFLFYSVLYVCVMMSQERTLKKEIMFEIFSSLPVKSLLCFKCITKFCMSLISESDFVNIHTCRSMSRPGGIKFLLHERWESSICTAEQREDEKDSALFLQIARFNYLYLHGLAHYSLLNCENGLCCMWDSLSTRPAAVFNPSTR